MESFALLALCISVFAFGFSLCNFIHNLNSKDEDYME